MTNPQYFGFLIQPLSWIGIGGNCIEICCDVSSVCAISGSKYCDGTNWVVGEGMCYDCSQGFGDSFFCDGNGNCVNADGNDAAAANVCKGCIAGANHHYEQTWLFESGTIPQCCGDDIEFMQGCYDPVYSIGGDGVEWARCNLAAAGCCDKATDCVTPSGQCYAQGIVSNMNPAGNDNYAVCAGDSWYDCDYKTTTVLGKTTFDCGSICGNANGVTAGEAGVGEYIFTGMINPACCGDDKDEYYAPLCSGVTGVTRKCCNSEDDCIDADGNCYGCGEEGETCTEGSCCGGLWCDVDDGGYCCPFGEKWVLTPFPHCEGTTCGPPTCTTPFDPGCVGVSVSCLTDEACCPVNYGIPTVDCLQIQGY